MNDPFINIDEKSLPASAWLNPENRFKPAARSNLEPKVDEIVSKIVGRKIYLTDPRLLKLVIKWEQQSGMTENSLESINHLADPHKINELKEVLSKPI